SCEGGAKSKKKETDVAIKEIKSGYDITLDFISMRGLLPNEEKTKVIRESFEPFDKIQIESSYTPREGVFYIRRTLVKLRL
ncbi:11289_t:CDS:2, partial [Entrophospora sp. SA101]